MESTKLVLFEVNHQIYGIHIEQVLSIEKYMEPTPVPNSPDYIKGMLSLRGDMILVYDLRTKFQLETKLADENTKMILVQIKDLMVAFIVDCVTEIVDVEQKSFNDLPKVIQSEQTSYIESVSKVQNHIVITFCVEGLLDQEDTIQIQSALSV